jgi:hypothetical protein
MKAKWLVLTITSVLLVMVLGVAIFQNAAAPGLRVTKAEVEPKPIDLYNSDDVTFILKVVDENNVTVTDQIDPASIVVEGWITPYETSYHKPPPEFTAKFDGTFIVQAIWNKINHMQIVPDNPWNPVKVPLTITGALLDGRTFEGTGYAKVYIGMSPPHH